MLCGGTSPAGQMGPLFDAEVIGRLIGDVLEARRRAMACRNQDWDEMYEDTRRMLGMTSEDLLEELFGEVENEISDSEDEGQSKLWHKHGDELWEGQQLQRLGDLWAPEHSFDSMRPITETGPGEPTSFRGFTFPLAPPPDRPFPHPTRIDESNKKGKGKAKNRGNGKGKDTDEGKGKGKETEDSDSDSFEKAYERQQEFRKRRLRKFRDMFRDVQAGIRQSYDETTAIIQGSSNGGTVAESSSSASARAVIEEDDDESDLTDGEIEYREEFYMRFFGSHAFLEDESDADAGDSEDEEDEDNEDEEDNEGEQDIEEERGNEGEEDNDEEDFEDDEDEYEDEELYVDYGELITYPRY